MNYRINLVLLSLLLTFSMFAQGYKVDMNMSGRQDNEVLEPGYLGWAVKNQIKDSLALNENITVFLSSKDNGKLRANWYKAGISTAKLANDGAFVEEYTGAAQIEMKITGLSVGTHSILTYHSMVDNPTVGPFAPMDIYVNGALKAENIVLPVRVEKNDDAYKFFTEFTVEDGGEVVILFKSQDDPAANNKTTIINAFEIDTRNANLQALNPFPTDRNEHVDADDGKVVTLQWQSPEGIVSHDIYFGTNIDEVTNADHSSSAFKGNQTHNTYDVSNLYSMNTYYWRIDEVSDSGTTKGEVWYFRPRQLAFDGAEGYGRFARGGRGGKVVTVTNLSDNPESPAEGSLRWALQQHQGEPVIIVFNVSGLIDLQDRLTINRQYVTVAGQTAPGKGICIKGKPFGLSGAHDSVVRFMRVRVGGGQTTDGMGLNGCNNSIIDHSSISWTVDESFSSRSALNISFQRNLISEPLNIAGHKNYGAGAAHGYAASIGGDVGSFHHNLLSQSAGRNWSMAGGLDGNGYYSGRLDLFNNVVYNWDGRTTDGGAHEVNFVNNYYKAGAATSHFYMLTAQLEGTGQGSQSYYVKGNVLERANGTISCDGTNDDCGRRYTKASSQVLDWTLWVDEPFFPSYAKIESAKEAYKHVLSDVGATMPVFDDHDKRIIQETLTGINTYTGSVGKKSGIPDDEKDVGGWEDYGNEIREADFDSDHDGLPDWWEKLHGLNPNSPAGDFSDTNADPNGDGFTNMDHYLGWLSNPHYKLPKGQTLEVDLVELTKGFEDAPVYSIVSTDNCSADIQSGKVIISPISSGKALGNVVFKVTDAEGHSLTREIGLLVNSDGTAINEIKKDAFDFSCNTIVSNTLLVNLKNQTNNTVLVEISDICGKRCIAQKYDAGNISVDVSLLSNGIYLAKVTVGNESKTIKIIKR